MLPFLQELQSALAVDFGDIVTVKTSIDMTSKPQVTKKK